MNAAQLTASIKLSNNGYLFAPTTEEIKAAQAHPELFTIRGHTILLAGHDYAKPHA